MVIEAKSELHWCYGRPWEVDYLAAEYLSSANTTTANHNILVYDHDNQVKYNNQLQQQFRQIIQLMS